jgi:hypothetical protein
MTRSLRLFFLSCAALAAALYLPAASGAPAAPAAQRHANRLLSVEVLRTYNPARRRQVQQALSLVFADDAAYAAARGTPGKPLDDEMVGPITLSFINRFWLRYNLQPVGNLTEDAVEALLAFARTVEAHPDWKPDVVSSDFAQWVDRQPDKAQLYRIRLAADEARLPGVLARYRARAGTAGAGNADMSMVWYGLDADGIKSLTPEEKPAEQDEAPQEQETEQVPLPEPPTPPAAPSTLPAPLAALLADMPGLQYPQRDLFDAAVIERLRTGFDACLPGRSPEERERLKPRLLKPEAMEEVEQAVLETPGPGPAGLAKRLRAMWADKTCSAVADPASPDAARLLYEHYSGAFDAVAAHQAHYDAAAPLALSSDLCGCNTGNLKGEVVRFYPFWRGGADKLDFSLVSRIDYYGVTFDDNGELAMASASQGFGNLYKGAGARRLDFITAARRHLVKVDWVIHRADWRGWEGRDAGSRQRVLQHLTDNIVALLDAPMTDLSSKLRPWISAGLGGRPGRGDGVTLYFDGYPADDASVEAFYEFVGGLRARLTAGGFELNIMLRHAELDKGIYRLNRLARLVTLQEEHSDVALFGWARHKFDRFLAHETAPELVQPRYLILLEDPTAMSKKALRAEIEKNAFGSDRVALLRRIVPVVNFDGGSWHQLEDDLIYFAWNFGGVGFWPGARVAPAPAEASAHEVSCDISKNVENCVRDYFRDPAGESTTLACNLVCENRVLLRCLLAVLVLGIAGAALTWRYSCRLRRNLERLAIVLVVVSVLAVSIFGAMLSCDPFLDYWSKGLIVPALLLLAIVGVVLGYRRQLKERDERP